MAAGVAIALFCGVAIAILGYSTRTVTPAELVGSPTGSRAGGLLGNSKAE
ncbi:MAG: hypothetical protein AAGF01_24030 [Cyanobacteria bacterium P01_G01_bin.38]